MALLGTEGVRLDMTAAHQVAEQAVVADREARKAVTNQCAIKLAGAVHFGNVVINVNR